MVSVLPPLRELIEAVLAEASRAAAPVSIVGAVVLVWGTSRFVVAFQRAIARVMGGDRGRGILASNLAALGAVVLMIGVIVAEHAARPGCSRSSTRAPSPACSVSSATRSRSRSGCCRSSRPSGRRCSSIGVVPTPSPPWPAVIVPGVAVGLALTILARLFVFLAPRLIGAAAFIGALATAFAALAWLGLSFQAVLLGAAWVRDRATRIRPPGASSDLA